MLLSLSTRILRTVDTRCLMKFAWNFGWKGMRSVQKFKRRLKDGVVFPPFLYLSIVNSCNLRCQGCWVDVAAKQQKIPAADFHTMIREAVEAGNSFFGILGGEDNTAPPAELDHPGSTLSLCHHRRL